MTEKLGGIAATPEGCAGIKRDLDRMKKWADRNFMKFNKEKCKVLQLRRNNPRHQDMLRVPSWKAATKERTWGSGGHQIDHEPTMYPCCKVDQWCVFWAALGKASLESQERWSFPSIMY